MKFNLVQPQKLPFKNAKLGQIFVHDSGIYIKTGDQSAVVLHKMAGLVMQEGKTIDIGYEADITLIVEATFIVGVA